MKNNFKKPVCVLLIILITFTFAFQSFAWYSDASRLEMTVIPGLGKISVNGEAIKSPEPVLKGGILYVPLRTVMEAFGAEVAWKGANNTRIVFRNTSADITTGKKQYMVNRAEKAMEASPLEINGTVMVPVSFIVDNFGMEKKNDAGGAIKLILPDDGALSDLSFLTGGVGKQYIGNSYFGWSVTVPNGSRISTVSFNSSYVLVENDQREIDIQIAAKANDGITLEKYYKDVLDNPADYIDGEIISSDIRGDSGKPYAEFYYIDSFDDAVFRKVYVGNSHIISLDLFSYKVTDPTRITDDPALKQVIDSFLPEFNIPGRNTQDVSTVKNGLAKYENYIISDDGKKYLTWDISLMPEWNENPNRSQNPFYTEIGSSNNEYFSLEMDKADEEADAASIGRNYQDMYSRNFAKGVYTLISEGRETIDGQDAYSLVFSIDSGKKTYVYDEKFIRMSGIIYDITLKCEADKYEKMQDSFNKMLETFHLNSAETEVIRTDIEKYRFTQNRSRVGKDNSPAVFEDKNYGWSLKIPGYWTKGGLSESPVQTFSNSFSGSTAAVESVENSKLPSGLSDENKFLILSSLTNTVENITKDTVSINGKTAVHLKFRTENGEDSYEEVNAYIIKGSKYDYCVITAVPDLTASDFNIEELRNIVYSFTLKG